MIDGPLPVLSEKPGGSEGPPFYAGLAVTWASAAGGWLRGSDQRALSTPTRGGIGIEQEVDNQLPQSIIPADCPGGGIGIRGRLRACARKGVEVRLLSGAYPFSPVISS